MGSCVTYAPTDCPYVRYCTIRLKKQCYDCEVYKNYKQKDSGDRKV
jgi:hypothetical protein